MTPIRYDTPFVFHYRYKAHFEKGGLTIVFDPASRTFAATKCNKRDNYNKKRGVAIALGRIKKWRKRPSSNLSRWIWGTLSKEEMFVEKVRDRARNFAAQNGFGS